MLYLISIGLYDEKDISVKAIETAAKCDKLYAEFYTSNINTNAGKIENLIEKISGVKKTVNNLKRSDLEENSEKLISEAKNNDIGILVGGDALVATTHITLLMDAKKMNVKTKVIHGSSIYSAVGETGLQLYKFGRTTTLSQDFAKSCYNVIMQNKKLGLHTLVLLDIGLTAEKGIQTLAKRIDPKEKIVVACQLGGNSLIRYGTINKLLKSKELLGKTPSVIIIPGELHFIEKEFLHTI